MTLQAQSVDFSYRPGRRVLSSVMASFVGGRVTAIIGPNGAGKSTLLRLLAGLSRPDSGRITLGETDVSALGARESAARIAYVPQRPSVAFAFTVGQVVRLGRFAVGRNDRAVEQALERAEVADLVDEPFGTLSVGQQQRVTLARSLAQLEMAQGGQDRALLADEPVSAMDPRHAISSMTLLRGVAREGASVVAVLHDLTLASCWADEVVVLGESGSVEASGACEEVLEPKLLERVFATPFVRTSLDGPGGPVALTPMPASGDIIGPHG